VKTKASSEKRTRRILEISSSWLFLGDDESVTTKANIPVCPFYFKQFTQTPAAATPFAILSFVRSSLANDF